MQPHLYFTGFMGTGKSAVSRETEKILHFPLEDTDQMIVEKEGMPVTQIFADKGEAYFRNAETQLLKSFDTRPTSLISCGGGVVLNPENVKIMKSNGIILLLTATAETVYERVKGDRSRPLLKGRMSPAGIQELMDQRREKYEAAADGVIATDHLTIPEVAQKAVALYQTLCEKR